MMNVLDIGIVILLLFGFIIGYKRGFTKEIVSFLGLILAAILAFAFKNEISVWMYYNLPFFGFGGMFKGVTVLNILLYEIIAFLLTFTLALIGVRLMSVITSLLEKIFDFTIILGFVSSVLGGLVGVLHYYTLIFIALYILSFPTFSGVMDVNDSMYGAKMLEETPILSPFIDDSMDVINEFIDLKDRQSVVQDANEYNLEALDLLLKYDVISVSNVDYLVEANKLKITNIDSVVDKYREAE